MHAHIDPTVITVAQTNNPGRVAPILRSADRSSCSRFVDELRDFAVRMSLMRPEPAPTNSQNSRRSSRNPAPEPAEEAEEEVNPEEIRFNLHDALAEDSPVDQEEEEEVPLLYSDNSDVSDEEKPDLLCLVGAQDPDDLESLLLPYIPRCIAPDVLDTFLVIHQISPKKPKKILKYLLFSTRVEDTAKAYQMFNRVSLPLNCRDADEAITRYTRDFMKVARKVPSLQKEEALARRFLSGIRPKPLKRLLKTEAEDGLITSIPEVIFRLKELLPDYHRPYSRNAYLIFREQRARSTTQVRRKSYRTPRRGSRTQSSRPDTRSTQPRTRTPQSNQSHELICNYCKKPGHVVRDCPDPNCKLSQVNKKKPYKNPRNPTHSRTHSTRNKTQSNSIVESIKEGLKEDYSIDETYYSRTVTHSSSSDTEDLAYNVSLNPLSINSDSYSEDTSNSPSPNTFLSDSNCYDLDDVFENLDFVLPGRDFPSFQDLTYVEPSKPQIAKQKTPSFPARCARNEVLKSSRAATIQDERVSSCEASVVEKVTDSSLTSRDSLETDLPQIHDQRKALMDNIHDFSLERASSHLDSDMALLDADCAQGPGPSDKNSSLEESSESSVTESANTLVAAKISAPAPACLIFPDKSKIFFTLKELNQPMDKNLLHLKIFTKPDHFLYGMVDTGATVSCISEEIAEVAKLHIENQTTSLSLADGKLIDVKLAKGRFAFMLGETAKLIYLTLRLCLLPCPNNFILGCDALKRLGLSTEDFLFINLSTRNLQIQEDESIPDCFLPDSQNVCSHDDLSDTSTALNLSKL
ncbi:hypothetical protein P9112_003304 [Eukaryota sp. TZLM1-RC]